MEKTDFLLQYIILNQLATISFQVGWDMVVLMNFFLIGPYLFFNLYIITT